MTYTSVAKQNFIITYGSICRTEGFSMLYSCCLYWFSSICVCVYIYIYNTHRSMTYTSVAEQNFALSLTGAFAEQRASVCCTLAICTGSQVFFLQT